MNACDCMWLTLLRKKDDPRTPLRGGALFFIPGLEKEEQIADYIADGGWIDRELTTYH